MNIEADVRESLRHLTTSVVDTDKFRYLGKGISRRAWLHRESGDVVKIGDESSNANELRNVERLYGEPSLKGKVNIPVAIHLFDIDHYDSVILAEFVDGEATHCDAYFAAPCTCGRTPCHVEVQRTIHQMTDVYDLHYDNVLVKGDEYWIVDLGDD